MAADVSRGQSEDEKKKGLVTRDLLSGKCVDEKELWEEKFEFLSRKSEHDANHVLHDLNLPPPMISYSSICTLEKVKIALKRAMRDPDPNPRAVAKLDGSTKRRAIEVEETDGQNCSDRMNGGSMMVTVCPGCFQYLLVPKANPSCPKCDRNVPVAFSELSRKRARIDLNGSTSLNN